MTRRLFVTGASGFLGRHLLEALARQRPDTCFFVLARPAAAKKLQTVFAWMEPERLQIVSGDLTLPDLGLAPVELTRVLEQTSELWHLAASTSFNEAEREQIEQANVGGTTRVLELTRRIRHLDNFYYASTAYAVGRINGPVGEDSLPDSPQFNNTYERTKWESERLVRQSGLPCTIFRPSIMIGDSRGLPAGEKRMMYGYLLGIYCAVACELRRRGVNFHECWRADSLPEVALRLVGHNTTLKNFVCVDDITATILAILASPHQGKTFNLVNPRYLVGTEVRDALEGALRFRGIRYVGESVPQPTVAEKAARRYGEPFIPYTIHSDPRWVTANTDAAVNGHGNRITMTPELLGFLLRRFVEQEIIRADHA